MTAMQGSASAGVRPAQPGVVSESLNRYGMNWKRRLLGKRANNVKD